MRRRNFCCFIAVLLLLILAGTPSPARPQTQSDQAKAAPAAESPIRFAYQPIDFKLDSSETPERHAPETMAGGVAVFDYNNDGNLDIFSPTAPTSRLCARHPPSTTTASLKTTAKGTSPM